MDPNADPSVDPFDDRFDIFAVLGSEPPVAPHTPAPRRKPRAASAPKPAAPEATESVDPAACPPFKAVASTPGRATQLVAPAHCLTIADVVKAFNADADFTFCDLGSADHRMAASRADLWALGLRTFLVRYHRDERLTALVPCGRRR